MLVSGVNFSIGIVLARKLGLEGYGVFTLIWLIFVFCASIHQAVVIAPMFTLGAKEVTKDRTGYFRFIVNYQIAFSVITGIACLLSLSIAGSIREIWDLNGLMYVVSITVPVYLLQDFNRRLLFFKRNRNKAFVIDFIAYGGYLLGVFALVYLESLTVRNILLTVLLSFGISSIIGMSGIKKFILKKPEDRLVKSHIEFSKWLLASSVFQWFTGNYFIVIGSATFGPWVVGVVKSIQNIMGLFHVFFLGLENFVPTNAAALFNTDLSKSAVKKYLLRIFKIGFVLILTISCVLAFFHKEIVNLLYGSDYATYSYFLLWFMGLYLLNYTLLLYRYYLRTIEKTSPIFYGYLVGFVFSIISAQFIINQGGYLGIIYGMISIQIITIIYYVMNLKTSS